MTDPHLNDLISAADDGSGNAADELFALLYRELHRLAESSLRRAGGPLTLGATTLLHEAYLNLSRREQLNFPDEGRFLAYASRAMRGLIIDYARRQRAQKRGHQFEMTLADDQADTSKADAGELQRLSDALDELGQIDADLAQLVDLHFFCGYTFAEIAAVRDVSERTVQRQWRKARLLLHQAVQPTVDTLP